MLISGRARFLEAWTLTLLLLDYSCSIGCSGGGGLEGVRIRVKAFNSWNAEGSAMGQVPHCSSQGGLYQNGCGEKVMHNHCLYLENHRKSGHSWFSFLSMISDICVVLRILLGEGNGNPLQCSCLENPRDRGACGLPSMGSHRAGHDWSDAAIATAAGFRMVKWVPHRHKYQGLCWGP